MDRESELYQSHHRNSGFRDDTGSYLRWLDRPVNIDNLDGDGIGRFIVGRSERPFDGMLDPAGYFVFCAVKFCGKKIRKCYTLCTRRDRSAN